MSKQTKLRRSPKDLFAQPNGPVVLAHRGWRGYYPENTMLALQKAAELPIDALEIDIHRTADNVLVVIHDETVDRTTNGTGPVRFYSLEELQALDAGYTWTNDAGKTFPFRGKGTTIPTLEEVYKAFPDLWINIDIKQHDPQTAQALANFIRRLGVADRTCVGSFDDKTIYTFRGLAPSVCKSGSPGEIKRLAAMNLVRFSRFYKPVAHVFQMPEYRGNYRVVTKRFVEDAHKHNIAVHVWTVNNVRKMEELLNLGVDGIITDYPDRLLKLLGRM